MFNLLRLFRRNETIDDTATAYIEGRATERDEAELRDRSARDPGLIEDLDSIRQTVSLLRSIQSVSAPRSFALAEAPVRARRNHGRRLAMAPAVFAIAAAAAVGLLAVGNLADVVRQSNGSSADRTTNVSSNELLVTGTGESEGRLARIEPAGPEGPAGPAGSAGGAAAATVSVSAGQPAQEMQPLTTPTITALPTSQPMPLPTTVVGEIEPEVAPSSGRQVGPAPATALPESGLAPSMEDGTIDSEMQDLATITESADSATAGTTPSELPPKTGGLDEAFALPRPTVVLELGSSDALELATGDPSRQLVEQDREAGDESGYALPVWQLEVAFASFAVLMAGAWMLLQRRLTA